MNKNPVGRPGSPKSAADYMVGRGCAPKNGKGSRDASQEPGDVAEMAELGTLVSTFAHELRSPLGAMLTSLHVVESRIGAADPAAKKGLDRIRRSVWRCDNIIAKLLDYSRQAPLLPEETGIDQWLRALFHSQSLPDGITLTFEPGLGDGRFRIDRGQMWRAIVHIIENAAQAILSGGTPGRIAASTRTVGKSIEIRIADNGPGVPEENRAKIFDPLFSGTQVGAGLGLPIAKRIVELHGGTISLDPSKGRETSVTITLPIDPVEQAGD